MPEVPVPVRPKARVAQSSRRTRTRLVWIRVVVRMDENLVLTKLLRSGPGE
jgi:hypothetical protein